MAKALRIPETVLRAQTTCLTSVLANPVSLDALKAALSQGLTEALQRRPNFDRAGPEELRYCAALLREEGDRARRIRAEAIGGSDHMTRKLLIVLVNTDPRNPEELGAPFYHAAVAAAMDYEVDVVCAATRASSCARASPRPSTSSRATQDRHDWIRDAHKNGARFWACPANLDLFDMTEAGSDPRVQAA